MLQLHHPGGGRGPIGMAEVTAYFAPSRSSPGWAPAFAGVVAVVGVVAVFGMPAVDVQ